MTPTNSEIEEILFDSIVALGVREEGAVTDLDTLIIDRQKAVDKLEALINKQIIEARAEGHHNGRYELAKSLIPVLEENLTKYEPDLKSESVE